MAGEKPLGDGKTLDELLEDIKNRVDAVKAKAKEIESKNSFSAPSQEIVKEIDDIHDNCGPTERNKFYDTVVDKLIEYTGAFNVKIELNTPKVDLPRAMGAFGLKKYHWEIGPAYVKRIMEKDPKLSKPEAEQKLRDRK